MISWVDHNPPLASPDYIHFTTKGAERVGDALSKSLLTYYDFYRLRKTSESDTDLHELVSSGNIDSFMDSIIAARQALKIDSVAKDAPAASDESVPSADASAKEEDAL